MKLFSRKYLVSITFVLLSILLFIQVRWIVYSFRTQENIFKRSANLALSQTIATLNANRNICSMMQDCLACNHGDSVTRNFTAGVWDQLNKTIDSELKSYNIDLDYDLFIIKDKIDTIRRGDLDVMIGPNKICYAQSLGDVLENAGYELVVGFPKPGRFFFRNTGLMFISSVVLILLILLSVIHLLNIYRRELLLAENIRELINNVSHEFKTPLSSISLAANLIRKGTNGRDPEKITQYTHRILSENRKLMHQVDSLLNLSAMEYNNFFFEKSEVDVNTLVREAAESIDLQLQEKGGEVSFQFFDEKVTVMGDRHHLLNSLVNLLINAVKYTAKKPLISVSTEKEGHKVLVLVKDNGIGIPVKYQKFIFDKYFRVPTGDVHDTKGFGIGLSYVKKVIEAHNGKVWVTSTPGEGSIFAVELPFMKPQL